MILDYDATKAAVDRVGQLCHNYSIQKRTKRRPLPYFYNCLNVAAINALVIYQAKFPDRASGKSHRRRIFLESLGMKLLQPWRLRRRLLRATKLALQKCGVKEVLQVTSETNRAGKRKRQRCHICPSVIDRKTDDCCSN